MLDWKPFEKWDDIPVGVPVLVYLPEMELFSHVHTATRVNNKAKTALVAGHFYYDMPTPTYWAEIPNIPKD